MPKKLRPPSEFLGPYFEAMDRAKRSIADVTGLKEIHLMNGSNPWSDHIRHGFRRVVPGDDVEIVSIEIYDHRRRVVLHAKWQGKDVILSLSGGTLQMADCESIGWQLGQNMQNTLIKSE